ncbi:carboxypeptidase-like regulatory domain-containing protein [Cytophagaceae bacterium ABcell3]|nr:carboxypeptidase-like regulatory domain-containing protein [Cytophagaceae bacterium ABcell3]
MKYRLTILALFFVLKLFASGNPISGVLLDAVSKEPLAYANIDISGKGRTYTTDSLGRFVIKNIAPEDTLEFSLLGYETLKMAANQDVSNVFLQPSDMLLDEVQVLANSLTAKEVVQIAQQNFIKNLSSGPAKKRLFFHTYEKIPFPEDNQINLKRSNFAGMDKKTFLDLYRKLPNEFVEYQNAIVDLYTYNQEAKLVPIDGISLESASEQKLMKEFGIELSDFFKDIEETIDNEEVYYKIRTGILSRKFHGNSEHKAAWESNKTDTVHITAPTKYVKADIMLLIRDYANIESKNWEFLNNPKKYNYTLELTHLNNQQTYKIDFSPKKKGLFEGKMYVSTSDYAILQLDFAYAQDKQTEKFQMFGVGHSMDFKQARVVFEKDTSGYYVKYIAAREHETASIERTISITKNQKRFLIDKKLSEIKMDLQLTFHADSYWELLVLEKSPIDQQQFNNAEQPEAVKYRKELTANPITRENITDLTPLKDLKKLRQRK